MSSQHDRFFVGYVIGSGRSSQFLKEHRHTVTMRFVVLQMMGADEKPDLSYADIGGSDIQKQEIREAVELPLTVSPIHPGSLK